MPATTRENVGLLTPADLVWTINFFASKYEAAE